MFKKISYIGVVVLSLPLNFLFAEDKTPPIKCMGLPGCNEAGDNAIEKVSTNIIAEIIQYVAVVAVIALMISGVMYMLSGGEEEKTKKAKTWIIYSVVAVVLSVSSYFIVSTLNEINLNL